MQKYSKVSSISNLLTQQCVTTCHCGDNTSLNSALMPSVPFQTPLLFCFLLPSSQKGMNTTLYVPQHRRHCYHGPQQRKERKKKLIVIASDG